jgi:hypothetical protein
MYNEPVIRPPLQPDVEGHGVPSDHSIAFAIPNTDFSKPPKRACLTKVSRPLTTEAKQKIELWIQNESWQSLLECPDASSMVEKFSSLVSEKLTNYVQQKL